MLKTLITLLSLALSLSVSAASENKKAPSAKTKGIPLEITSSGFNPNEIKVKAGEPITLEVKRTTDATCAQVITIPEYGVQQELKELGKVYSVTFTPKAQGKVKFGCSMDQMVAGWLIVQ